MASISARVEHSASGGRRSLPDLLCVDCAETLEVSDVAMTVTDGSGHSALVGASGPRAADLEDLQFDVGEGPSFDAFTFGAVVVENDLGATSLVRWPAFAPTALELGVWAVTALPLAIGGTRLGSLSLYDDSSGALSEDGTRTAHAYADVAVLLVLGLPRDWSADAVAIGPEPIEPVSYRAVIHQATGYLSVKSNLPIEKALLLLRMHAFAAGRPLADVARDVLSGELVLHGFDIEDD